MALFHFVEGLTWKQYLQENSYSIDTNGVFSKVGAPLHYIVSEAIKNTVANDETLSRTFGHQFDIANGRLPENFGFVGRKIGDFDNGMEDLGAAFEWGMGFLLFQAGVRGHLLDNITTALHEKYESRNSPILADAIEFYHIGMDRLHKKFLDKALDSFLLAEKKNDTDFLTQHALGHLYLYGMDQKCDLIDVSKAEMHFRNSARYAKMEVPNIPGANKICGEAYYYASVACYVQSAEYMRTGNKKKAHQLLNESAKLAINAAQVYPELGECFYLFARICALSGKTDVAVRSLKKAIHSDRYYCIKADADKDLAEIRPDVSRLFVSLRSKEKEKAKSALHELYILPKKAPWLVKIDKKEKTAIKSEIIKAKSYFDNGVLFDYLDCLDLYAGLLHKVKALKVETHKNHSDADREKSQHADETEKHSYVKKLVEQKREERRMQRVHAKEKRRKSRRLFWTFWLKRLWLTIIISGSLGILLYFITSIFWRSSTASYISLSIPLVIGFLVCIPHSIPDYDIYKQTNRIH